MPRSLVNNGRVTSRDASLHADGEVAEAQDCYYSPANPGLKSVLGRTAFNSSAEASALIGGAYLAFDGNGTPLIVTLRRGGTAYRKATAGVTGTFADLPGFDGSDYSLAGTATSLDQAHYRNQHVLVNGIDRPRVVSSDGTQMFLGMLATVNPPIIDRDAGAGSGFTLTSGQTMKYWIEERVTIAGVIVKRSSPTTAAIATLTGDGTLDKPRIHHPAHLNPDTTDWAVFSTGADGAFPVGAEVGSASAATAFIDDLRTTTGLPGGAEFEIVSVSILGLTTNRPKFGPPPIGSTVDTYADSLVMNDVAQPGQIAYCLTDNIHAWPDIFRIKFDSKFHDVVQAVRSLDNFFIVLLNNGGWRVNSLPKTTDQAFEPERTKAEIVGAHGTVGGKALAVFSFGEGVRLAYVSVEGSVVVTDGTRWSTISDDMDASEIDATLISKARLINNIRDFRLEHTFVPLSGARPTRTAFLHYHPSHAKSGDTGGLRAKMTWPIQRDLNDAFLVKINGVDEVFSCNEDGRVYRHDSGASEPTGGGITFKVRSHDDYPGDVGTDSVLREVWAHHQAAAGLTATVRSISRASGEADSTKAVTIPLDFREATPSGLAGFAEAFQFEFEVVNPASQVTLDYFVPDYDFAGKTEDK